MPKIFLFDWGNTLMVDFADATGKMCDWPVVECVTGAPEVLKHLSRAHRVYIATGAADSSEAEIKLAFERVGLSQYISGYFCQANLGVGKDNVNFYPLIASRLKTDAACLTMIGDDLGKDISPALAAGLNAIWFTPSRKKSSPGVVTINKLSQLID